MALTKITPQMFDTSATTHDLNVDNGTFVVDGSASRVGIGTATPSTLLDVNGALTATTIAGTLTTAAQTNITSVGTLTGLTLSGNLTVNANTNVTGNLTVDTNSFYVDATNNRVGIGTISADEKLHISGGIKVDGAATMASGAGTGLFIDYSSNVGRITSLDQGNVWRSLRLNAADIQFYIANGPIMTLESTGRLALGHTTTTGAKFAICDGANSQIMFFPEFSTDNNLTQHFDITASAYMASETRAASYVFKIANSPALTINSSSNATFAGTINSSSITSSAAITASGDITAGTKLISLADTVTNEGGHVLLRANTGGAKQYSIDVDTGNLFRIIGEDDSTAANGFVILNANASGNVAIGTPSSSSARLEVTGPSSTPLVLELNSANSNCDITMQSANTSSVTRIRNGTNDLQFHTNGAQRMSLDSSGVIRFGPDAQDIQITPASVGGHNLIYMRGNASGEKSRIQMNHYGHADYHIGVGHVANGTFNIANDVTGNDFVIDTNGNVGIGTTTPAMPLDIGENGSTSTVAGFRGGAYNQINIAHSTNASWGLLLGNSDGSSNTGYHYSTGGIDKSCSVVNVNNDALHFGTANLARMTIDHNGNVGIGTGSSSSPFKKLHVLGGSNIDTIMINHAAGNNVNRYGGIVGINYAGNQSALINYYNDSGQNYLHLGSNGNTDFRGPTMIRFYTASGADTTTHTERFRVQEGNSKGSIQGGAFGVSGINCTAAFHGVSNAALVLSTTNLSTSASSYGYAERGGRYLTSNGSGWTGDGKDPALVIGSSDSATNRVNVGIVLHNDHSNNNTFSPTISFGTKSNSTSYNTMYGYIMGRKVGQGVDANWSTGEIHMDTAGTRLGTSTRTAYMADIPAFMMDQHGDINMPYKAYAYGNMSGGSITPPSNGTGFALNTIRYQNCTPQTTGHGPGITITKAGFYVMYGSILYDPAGTYIYIGWAVNGTIIHHFHSNHAISANHDAISSIGRYLSVGDHVTIENYTQTITTLYGNAHSSWYMYKVG